jgi:hypothetical protein
MDDNCPDGLDCPYYMLCQEKKDEGDPCPLLNKEYGPDVPLDKIIM